MKRRALLSILALAAALPLAAAAQQPLRIGVIGSGRIGSTLGALWAKAGHEILYSDRDAGRRSARSKLPARAPAPAR